VKTLFERVFSGNDEMYAKAVAAVDEAMAKLGPNAPATFGDTAYSLPCLYAMTGRKVATVGEAKDALENEIKNFMTRNNRLKDAFTSGVATALSAEMIELMKYAMAGGSPYEDPVMGHFTDAQVRELGVPLVTRDIPGAAKDTDTGAGTTHETKTNAGHRRDRGELPTSALQGRNN